ncbi:MAG: hypothetical protein AAB019_09195 [Planctomycetota bacterium]
MLKMVPAPRLVKMILGPVELGLDLLGLKVVVVSFHSKVVLAQSLVLALEQKPDRLSF